MVVGSEKNGGTENRVPQIPGEEKWEVEVREVCLQWDLFMQMRIEGGTCIAKKLNRLREEK